MTTISHSGAMSTATADNDVTTVRALLEASTRPPVMHYTGDDTPAPLGVVPTAAR